MTRTRRLSLPFILLLVALILFGGGLRFWNLGSKSLWSDELFSAGLTLYQPMVPSDGSEWFHRTDIFHIADRDTFWTAKAADQSPPLFELVMKLSVSVLGPNEFAMRLPSALAGLLLLLWFGWQALRAQDNGDRAIYSWALLLMAVSTSLIEYAQEARAYSLGVLFAGILATFWYRRWRAGIDHADAPGWREIAVFVLACHTHYTLVILAAILLGTYAWLALSRCDFHGLVRIAVVPLACLPWVLLSAHTILFTSKGGVGWAHMDRLESVSRALAGIATLSGVRWLSIVACLSLVLIGRSLFGKLGKRRDSESWWRTTFALLSVIFLYLLLVAQLAVNSGVFHPRHFIYLLPFIYLVVGQVLARSLKQHWSAVSVALILVWASERQTIEYYQATKEPYREAAYFAVDGLGQDDPILTTWEPNRIFYRFYLERLLGNMTFSRMVSVSFPAEANAVCSRLLTPPPPGGEGNCPYFASAVN